MPQNLDVAASRTMGEKYGPAMEIRDQAEADTYFEFLVQHNIHWSKKEFGTAHTRAEAERIERSNLGYYAGYYDHSVRERVERLFRCAHPVFGSIAEKGPPTAEQALEAGLKMGRRGRQEQSVTKTLWDHLKKD